MGVYHRTGKYHNFKPTWTRHDGTQKIFYSDAGRWMIGNPASNAGGVMTKKGSQTAWPQDITDWQYWDGGKWQWHPDPTLIVTDESVFPDVITISSNGPTGEKLPDWMGEYR